MKKGISNHMPSPTVTGELRKSLQEAEIYADQGLFSEARKKYLSILESCRDIGTENSCNPSHISSDLTEYIQKKLKEIELFEKAFPQDRPDSQELSETDDGQFYFNKGIAYKNIGLYDEAIANFKKAALKRYRTVDCMEATGSVLIEKGQFTEGLEALRKAYIDPSATPEQKSIILDKISAASEKAAKNAREALKVYEELASLEKTPQPDLDAGKSSPSKRPEFNFLTIIRHRFLLLIFSSLVGAALIAFNPFVKIIDNVDYFTVEDNSDSEFYESFKEIFGGDDFFVVAFEATDIFTAENLATLKEITDELEMEEEIREITSLSNVEDIWGQADFFEVRPFIDEIPETSEELKLLKKTALGNPLYLDALISEDGTSTAILIETYEKTGGEDYKKRVIEKTRQILSKYEEKGIKFHLAGPTITNFTLSQYMNRDMAVFLPISYILITFAIFFFFKNIRLTVAALINVSVCVGATRGFMGMTGLTMNNVTSIVIPLVMALSLCDTVHIFSHMHKRIIDEMPDRFAALSHVLKQVALPCFMTTLTTAIGFMCLGVSKIPPIREFAWAASAGMLFEFFFSFFFLPPLLLFFKPSKIYQDYNIHAGFTKMLHNVSNFVNRQNLAIVTVSIILTAGAVWYAGKIRVETNLIEYFKVNSPIREATDFVETSLSGVNTFDVSMKAQSENAFKSPENLEVIEKIQNYIAHQKGVDKTISFVDFLKDMNESFHNENEAYFRIPDSREMVAQYLLLYDSADIEDFINNTFDHARISVRISEHSSLKQKEMIKDIKEYIAGIDQKDIDIRITGRAVNDINIIDNLVNGQILSLALAALTISIVMFFVFKSAALALLSMLPNFFPIIINFGVMGLIGIPLNTGTALIAAVALGIAVDDTIHFLSEYRNQRLQGMPVSKSLKSATLIKGRAILSSSLILSLGFGVTALSQFVPIVHFGLLTALIMLTAVVGDLVVLPAIISLKKEKPQLK